MNDSKMRNAAADEQQNQQPRIQNQQVQQRNQGPKVTVQQFGAKFQTKYSIHQFLTVEVGCYLPPSSCVTIYFMRDLLMGKKKYIKSDDVRLLSAPHYEGLTVEAFLGYCDQIEMMKDYLPEKEEERKRLPRAFIISVMYTVCGDEIRKWVLRVMESRNEKLVEKQNFGLQLDDEIQAVFMKSTSVATGKGSSHMLIKPGTKRRRTQAEVAMAKDAEELKDQVARENEQRIKELTQQLEVAKFNLQEQDEYKSVVNGMVSAGYIQKDFDGVYRMAGKHEDDLN